MARVLIRDIFRLRSNFPPSISPSFASSSSYPCVPSDSPNQRQILPCPEKITSLIEKCETLTQLHHIYAHFITSGRIQTPFWASKLLNLHVQLEDIRFTLRVFLSINYPDIVCINTMIKAYSVSPVPHQGVTFYFVKLKSKFFIPNSYTFPPLNRCSAKSGCAKRGGMCHGQAIKNGADKVVQVQNSLIHMYSCCGQIAHAWSVFDKMPEKDAVSWNSMIDGCMKVGRTNSAHSLFDVMPEKNVNSWNVMLAGYLAGNSPGSVLKLFRAMVNAGVIANDRTMVSLLTACGRSARLKEGASVHGFLVRRFWKSNFIVSTALIDMYCKCQKVEVAVLVFDAMSERNLVCWNSMILGHCLHGNPDEGLNLFADMIGRNAASGGIADEITFVGLLCACARAGYLAEGRSYFHEMIHRYGIKPNFAHLWCMANLLASNGLQQEAMETLRKLNEFDETLSPESFVWARLLGSCRFQRDVPTAEQVAKSLIELEPHNIMCYALLLNVYTAAGRWEHAEAVKDMVKERFEGKVIGCGLLDLIDIVHGFKIGEGRHLEMPIAKVVEDVVERLG